MFDQTNKFLIYISKLDLNSFIYLLNEAYKPTGSSIGKCSKDKINTRLIKDLDKFAEILQKKINPKPIEYVNIRKIIGVSKKAVFEIRNFNEDCHSDVYELVKDSAEKISKNVAIEKCSFQIREIAASPDAQVHVNILFITNILKSDNIFIVHTKSNARYLKNILIKRLILPLFTEKKDSLLNSLSSRKIIIEDFNKWCRDIFTQNYKLPKFTLSKAEVSLKASKEDEKTFSLRQTSSAILLESLDDKYIKEILKIETMYISSFRFYITPNEGEPFAIHFYQNTPFNTLRNKQALSFRLFIDYPSLKWRHELLVPILKKIFSRIGDSEENGKS